MQNDKTTLKDLSFLSSSGSVFDLLDFTITQAGKEALRKLILNPPYNYEELKNLQDVVKFFANNPTIFPSIISNGTLVMLEKFFESADHSHSPPSGFNLFFSSVFQKALNRNEYTFNQFSVSHISDFLKGCKELIQILNENNVPPKLKYILEAIKSELEGQRLTDELIHINKNTPYKKLARLSYASRREYKSAVYRLSGYYAKLDAYQSLAKATLHNKWTFPQLQATIPVCMEAKKLYHPLLQYPVSYDISFNENKNFMLLTGANMSGKTTFLRALGVSALLSHIGCGVPAASLRISFMQGIITNMHVEDNIMLGESYFMAEVQRIKRTAEKILQPLPHLVLMDELFKGTNVHDAYECTKAVVAGLLQHKHHIMILSTHLYEVAQEFKDKAAINFAYFVTDMTEQGNYTFTYELKKRNIK